MIKIQLLGDNEGYLDVLENSIIALNISVADIKDVTKRTGSFSKTIVLPGTKNNNQLLNDYFEVNVIDGTFSINKIQKCLILDDNIPLFNNTVLQLINVKKRQATNMEDDLVEYEISIKDTTADFFTIINNRYVNELDFSDLGHTYSAEVIRDSFSHSYVDGYKYVIPFADDNFYPITELKPAIYAKQYWNRIHQEAGYSYVWLNELALNIRFDKLLIPFSSGDIKLGESSINASRVIATGPSQNFPFSSGSVPSGGSYYSWFGSLRSVVLDSEIQDPLNVFNTSTSLYSAPFSVTQPSCYEWIISFDYQISIDNLQALSGNVLSSTNQYNGQFNIEASIYNQRTTSFDAVYVNASPTPTIEGLTFSPGLTTIYTGRANVKISTSNHQFGDNLELYVGVRHAAQGPLLFQRISEVVLDISNLEATIQINSNQVYNTPVNMNQYLPQQIKQSEFIKSIMMMFNLFVEVDPSDSNKLIYTARDEFYDSGNLIDWTNILAREDEQELRFLPELNAKSFIFTYKEDSDPANKGYKEVINEIYGQHQVIFSNNYVKGVETKQLIFSPTPMQQTNWNSTLPLIPTGNQKYNIRILLDNGNQPCQNWFLINYIDPNLTLFPPSLTLGSWVELNYYPLVSHLDAEFNPTYDINFGVCDFYFYDIRNITNNNLFNNFWRRTCGQINNGKLLTAYFYLKGSDIANLRLNAKIRIDNSYWNINKIIDFDANKQELTKVELISIDDELPLPTFGKTSQFLASGQQLATQFDPVFLSNNDIISKSVTQEYNNINHTNRTTNNSNNGVISLGSFNSINGGVKGIVVGDFIQASQSGIYVGQNTFIGENLGNIGGLPSTLVVDNTTGGTDIEITTGDKIISEAGGIVEINSDTGILSITDDLTNIGEIQINAGTINISTLDSGASVYNNNIFLDNSSTLGITIESINQSTIEQGYINVNEGQILQFVDDLTSVSTIDMQPGGTIISNVDSGASIYQNLCRVDQIEVLIESSDLITGNTSYIRLDQTTTNEIEILHVVSNTRNNIFMNSVGTQLNSSDTVTSDTGSILIRPTIITIAVDDPATTTLNSIDITQNFVRIRSDDNTDSSEIQIYPTEILISTDRINLVTLQPFADDAAAGAAGLVLGDLYQTDGTGAAPLNEKGIVMVKQ